MQLTATAPQNAPFKVAKEATSRRFQRRHVVPPLPSMSNGANGGFTAFSPDVGLSAQPPPPDRLVEEKFLSVSDILDEARAESEDLVFADDCEEEPVWELEDRFKRDPFTLDDLIEVPEIGDEPAPTQAPAPPQPEPVVNAYSQESGFMEMTVESLQAQLQQGLSLVDVRNPAEYAAGHIAGSVNVPLDSLSDMVRNGDLDHLKPVSFAVICASGRRSGQACVRLTKVFDFTEAVNVAGGVASWTAAGFPIEQGN